MGYTPHVAVVGGGCTGAGVARDLAMRGLEVTLLERGNLTDGATGRMHGLLHSGARYAVSDPDSAAQCIAENRRLRSIASHCIEETGGLFVELADDDGAYFEEKRAACEDCGIPVEEISGERVREAEPALAPDVERALRVPDATVDPFRLTVATAKSAMRYGATVRTHAEVTDVVVEDGAVSGLELARDGGEWSETLDPDYVVNATGAWAGRLAEMAGVEVPLRLSKGAMVVMDERPTDAVVNRCRPRDEGDIVVPYGQHCVLGATDEEVDDPDAVEEEGAEVDRLIGELSEMVPAVEGMRSLRSYWGVRPLYAPPDGSAADTREVTRDFVVLDHESRDGLWGISTVVGGKLTTHRLIAERVTDHVCAKFGIDRPCLTAEEPLPGSEDPGALDDAMAEFDLASPVASAAVDRLGSRATEVLDTKGPNPVVCPCESVTRAEVRDAMSDGTAEDTDLNAVRTRTGAAMGQCQGGRCAHRLATELYPAHRLPTVEDALADLFVERWKGQRHALWGDQLAEAMSTYSLHATTMNRDAEGREFELEAFEGGSSAGPGAIDGGQP